MSPRSFTLHSYSEQSPASIMAHGGVRLLTAEAGSVCFISAMIPLS